VREFEAHLLGLKAVYRNEPFAFYPLGLTQALEHQSILLHGEEAQHMRCVSGYDLGCLSVVLLRSKCGVLCFWMRAYLCCDAGRKAGHDGLTDVNRWIPKPVYLTLEILDRLSVRAPLAVTAALVSMTLKGWRKKNSRALKLEEGA
jgi:hypothetical protein